MQGPRREAVFAHLAFAHGVEEELEVPQRTAQRRQQVVGQQRRLGIGDGSRLAGPFAGRFVLEDQVQAPDEVGGEATGQHHAQHGQADPQRTGAGSGSRFTDWAAGVKTKGKEGRHDAGEQGDENTLFQVEFAPVRCVGVARHIGQLLFLGAARHGDDDNADDDDRDADEGDLAAGGGSQGADGAAEDRRSHGADHRCQAECHGHAERQAEIAHGQAECKPAKAPAGTAQIADQQGMRRNGGQYAQQILAADKGADPRRQHPREDAAGQPEDFPRPEFDALVRYVEAGGGQAPQPVKKDA